MKTFDERMASIREKSAFEVKKRKNRRIAAGALAGVFAFVLALVLFVPYSTELPDVSRYAGSPYYNVIQGLNKATYTAPKYKNNFDYLMSNPFGLFLTGSAPMSPGEVMPDGINGVLGAPNYGESVMDAPNAAPESDNTNGKYEEVTDNQVEGVIEADLFKRSDKHLYYLCNNVLYVYTIAQENTTRVGAFQVNPLDNTDLVGNFYGAEMYLTTDCSTIVIMMEGYVKTEGAVTTVVSLDVTDPANITCSGTMLFTGSYISSRMVGDDILLTYNYGFNKGDIDFGNPETFVPKYGTPGNLQLMEAEDIICPEDPSATRYTVVAKLNNKSLDVKDTAALMSYSQQLYVSQDTIYATHSFTKRSDLDINTYLSTSMTEITGIAYTGDELEVLGSIQLEGRVKDQYSMDQYEGILRVAVSTMEQKREEYSDNLVSSVRLGSTKRNCSLYCIDLSTWQVAASVENFAPDGDEVTSARFDGNNAYICTAEVIVLTDPVYFFDLSDIHNITWSDTGIIDGYSSSLVNFGDYLLGIGFGDGGEMKLEAYVEGKNGVESIGIYERNCSFASDYKAYYIDRENNIVGIPVQDWEEWEHGNMLYLLLQFDGYKFHELKIVPMESYSGNATRATVIDGWLYILYGASCTVEQVG